MDSGFPTLGDWYDRITANTATTLRYVYVAFSNDGRLLPGGVVLCLLLIVGLIILVGVKIFHREES